MKVTVDSIHDLKSYGNSLDFSIETVKSILPIGEKVVATITKGSGTGIGLMSFIFTKEGDFRELYIFHNKKGQYRYKIDLPQLDNLELLVEAVNEYFKTELLTIEK